MKNLFLVIPLVFLICFTFSCQQGEELAVEPGIKALSAEDVAAIKALAVEFDETALVLDRDKLLTFFTEDALLMPPNMPKIQGHAALMEILESYEEVTEHILNFEEIEGYGDIAYARGSWAEEFKLKGIEEPIKDKGKLLAILRKQDDGSWRIAIWLWNSELPLPE